MQLNNLITKTIKCFFALILVIDAFVLVSMVGKPSQQPRKMLILHFDYYEQMKNESELLFKKGWQVKHLEAFQNGLPSRSEFVCIYEK